MVDRIAAVVNDDVITLSEVYDLGADYIAKKCPTTGDQKWSDCVANAELEVLDSLIRRSLMHQELTKLQQDITPAEVDQAIDHTVQQYQLADRQALRDTVEASGKKWEQYRDELTEYLRTQAFQGRVLAPRISISEDELRDLYQRTARTVMRPVAKVHGFAVAIPSGATPDQQALALSEAQSLVDQINSGKVAWDDAVKQYDVGLAGSFGDVSQGSLIEPLNTAVFNAPIGVAQPPLRMSAGNGADLLVILRVDEKASKSDASPFEEVKDQLQEQVFQTKLQDAEEEWYQRARREAAVSVKLAPKTGS